jgi:hypothetical protein
MHAALCGVFLVSLLLQTPDCVPQGLSVGVLAARCRRGIDCAAQALTAECCECDRLLTCRCCWLEGADTVADSALMLSLGFTVTLVAAAASAGMPQATVLTRDAKHA